METTSSISFQSSDNVNSCSTSIHEYYKDSNKKNDQFSISVSEIMLYSNPRKRKHAYRGNNYESDLPAVANKKMMIGNREHEKKEETEMSAFDHESSTMNCWSAEQSESDAFNSMNPHWMSSNNLQFQELSHLVFPVCD